MSFLLFPVTLSYGEITMSVNILGMSYITESELGCKKDFIQAEKSATDPTHTELT